MNGLMMDMSLSIASIVEHAERVNGDAEIVSITAENPRHRYTYREAFARARKLGDIVGIIRQQDVIAKRIDWHSGITRQPVLRNFETVDVFV